MPGQEGSGQGNLTEKTTLSPVETYAYLGRTSVTLVTQSCLPSRPFRTPCHSAREQINRGPSRLDPRPEGVPIKAGEV